MHRSTPLSILALVLLVSSCTDEPPQTTDLEGVSGSWSCDADGDSELWTFEVTLAGPANENSTRVWVDGPDEPATEGHLMTVIGEGGGRTTFGTTLSGTPAGEDPVDGAIPAACEEADTLFIRFCGSPDGMPYEVPCWVCADDSGRSLPENADDWLDCES